MPVSPNRSKSGTVSTPAQWAAVASPHRFEIMEILESRGPASAAELAVWLDRPADGLYHHLRKLTEAGLVQQAGTRKIGRHHEAVFELINREARFEFDPDTGWNVDGVLALGRAILRRGQRHLANALGQRGTVSRRPGNKNLHLRGVQAWLSDEELARVSELTDELCGVFAGASATQAGTQVSMSLLVTPVVRTRGAASRPTRRQSQIRAEAHSSRSANGTKNESEVTR
jgi:DNA-binding transcriptional ArsR family regulator